MDGTLLNKDAEISPRMHEALERLTSNGHLLVLATGRPFPSVKERIANLGLRSICDYVITNNGCLIYDLKANKPLYQKKLSKETIKKSVDIALSFGLHVHSYSETEIVGLSEDKELAFYRRRIFMPFVKTDDISETLKDGAFKVQIISLSDKERLKRAQDALNKELSGEAEAFFSNDYYLEVLPYNVTKGSALKYLADYLNVPIENTFAAGDEGNDIPMIVAAGTGVAMKNAKDDVKLAADIVTKDTNADDGLIEIIEKHFN